MKRWTRFLGIITTDLVLLMATGIPARAAGQAELDKSLQAMLKEQQRMEQAVQKLEPYLVRYPDGTFDLDVNEKMLRRIGVARYSRRPMYDVRE